MQELSRLPTRRTGKKPLAEMSIFFICLKGLQNYARYTHGFMDARYIWSLFTNISCFSVVISRYLCFAFSDHGQRREMAGPRSYSSSAAHCGLSLNSDTSQRDRASHSAKSHARGDADASNRCKAYRSSQACRIPLARRFSDAGGPGALSLRLQASGWRSPGARFRLWCRDMRWWARSMQFSKTASCGKRS